MLLDFVFELEQLELMHCISLFNSWYDKSQASFRESFAEDLRGYLKPPLQAEFLHCVFQLTP